MNNLISLKNISKSFSNNRKINVLKKINYSFTKGKIYSLVGPREKQRNTWVQYLLLLIMERTIVGVARRQVFSRDCRTHVSSSGTWQPHNAYPPSAGRCSYSNNCVVIHSGPSLLESWLKRLHQDFAAAFSICRVMKYCCAIDNRLFTSQ